MRLANGIVLDMEKTFGELRFSGLRRTTYEYDEEGNLTDRVKSRTYDLKSTAQGDMISVKLPPEVPEKTFGYNDVVVLAEPEVGAVSGYGAEGASVNWYVSAKDILFSDKAVKKNKAENKQEQGKTEKQDFQRK